MMIDERSSLCFQHAEQERLFHYCTTCGNSPVCLPLEELRSIAGADCRTRLQCAQFIGEILGLVSAAEKGDLDSSMDQTKPIVSEPPIRELRYSWRRQPYRLYYTESLERKPEFVGLSFTKKSIQGTTEEINQAQNGDAQEAQRRFREYRGCQWGHPTGRRACKYCNINQTVSGLV